MQIKYYNQYRKGEMKLNKEKLRSWLNIGNHTIIQMPNEIFEDLNKTDFKNFNHKCFAYAFYYLCCYLYRNALYGMNTEQYSQQNIIKVFTGNKTIVSYITKSDGLLDQIGYTRTTTDYPVACYMDNGILEFSMIKDLRKRMPKLKVSHSPRFSIKQPIKALVRFNGEDLTGTFYSYQNTHKIDINRFIDIISDDQLGHIGLFIYGYISMMCARFPQGFQISNEALSEIVGCGEKTIRKYTQGLEAIGVLKSTRKSLDNKSLEKIYSIV